MRIQSIAFDPYTCDECLDPGETVCFRIEFMVDLCDECNADYWDIQREEERGCD